MKSEYKITLVGLGKLGLPFLAAFASRGLKVIGVDIDIDKLCKLSWGTFRLVEPGVNELLEHHSENYCIMNKVVDAVSRTDVTFILVPTPSEVSGAFSTQFVLDVCKDIAQALKQKKNNYHLISVLSTVMPGSMIKIKEYLETESGKKCGEDFGLCYTPELVAIGNVLNGFLSPDFVMIGESDARAGRMMTEIYRKVFLNNPPMERSNFVNTELAKITLNAYITTKISFANSLAEICEKIPEADANRVTEIIGQDKRIGKRYLKPALGFSGFCVKPNELIQSSAGLIPISAIKIGDKVLSNDGLYHKVTKVFSRPVNEKLLRIKGTGNFPFSATSEHPILARSRFLTKSTYYMNNGKKKMKFPKKELLPISWIEAQNLKVGDFLTYPIPRFENNDIPKIDLHEFVKGNEWTIKTPLRFISSPEFFRFLGYYLSEGFTYKRDINFSFDKDETTYLNDLASLIMNLFNSKTRIKTFKGSRTVALQMTCSSLAQYLKRTFGDYSYEKSIPQDWLGLPKNFLIEIIRSQWYGDGHLERGISKEGWKKYKYTWASVSRELANQMRLMLLRLEIPCRLLFYPAHENHRDAYFIQVSSPDGVRKLSKILPEMSIVNTTKNKRTIWFEDGYLNYSIKSIEEETYNGLVYNLEVKGSENYCLLGATVHNCFPRDSRAFIYMAKKTGVGAPISEATDIVNDRQVNRVVTIVQERLPQNGTVSVLGIAFKSDTDTTEESQGLGIAQKLADKEIRVFIHDPLRPENLENLLIKEMHWVSELDTAIKNADIIIIANPCEEFKDLLPENFKKGAIVIDCWKILDEFEFRKEAGMNSIKLLRLGAYFDS